LKTGFILTVLNFLLFSTSLFSAGLPDNKNNIEIASSKDGSIYKVNASFIIDAKPGEVWHVLNDYEHHAEFIPQCIESKITKKDGSHIWVNTAIKVLFFKMRMTNHHVLDEKNYIITWDIIKGPFEINKGTWKLEVTGNNKTKVNYEIFVVHKYLHDWMAAAILKKSLPKYFNAIINRIVFEQKKNIR
jgi:ribosome-associated toxin RatA of RatAB toxin-antitoxin module